MVKIQIQISCCVLVRKYVKYGLKTFCLKTWNGKAQTIKLLDTEVHTEFKTIKCSCFPLFID